MLRNGRITAVIRRAYSQPTATSGSGPSAPPPPVGGVPISNVTGLSSKCVKTPAEPVGPGAATTGQYKVPEYFSFNRFSYAEAEVEMAKYRLPQPSANIKK